MRLSSKRIQEAILHPEINVRDAALQYFSAPRTADDTIIPLVIQAFERYGDDAFGSPCLISGLPQTAESMAWFIQSVERVKAASEIPDSQFARAFISSLIGADPVLLELYAAEIAAMQHLGAEAAAMILNRVFLNSFTVEELWTRLLRICEVHDRFRAIPAANRESLFHLAMPDLNIPGKNIVPRTATAGCFSDGLTKIERSFVYRIVGALARFCEPTSVKTLSFLENPPHSAGKLFDDCMCRLAGRLRLSEAVPYLFRREGAPYTYLYELAQIGSEGVIWELVQRFEPENLESCWETAYLLSSIHSDFSVRAALEFAKEAHYEVSQCEFLRAALNHFAFFAIEPARKFILSGDLNPEIVYLRNSLLDACKIMGETFPEYEGWLGDSLNDDHFLSEWEADHPMDFLLPEEAIDP